MSPSECELVAVEPQWLEESLVFRRSTKRYGTFPRLKYFSRDRKLGFSGGCLFLDHRKMLDLFFSMQLLV